jgi:hypothetical protein
VVVLIYIYIYLTAIGLTPGGSSTSHISEEERDREKCLIYCGAVGL